MRTLLSIVTSVLNGDRTIRELPNNKLIATQGAGKPINGTVSREVLQKVARLQTLAEREREKSEMPGIEVLMGIASETLQNLPTVMARSMDVQEDAKYNIIMLERLIVAVVRESCPQECERFGVRYFADVSCQIFYDNIPKQRFMD